MDKKTISSAGDPFYAAAHNKEHDPPCACLEGWIFVGYIDEYGEEQRASYKCRRCNAGESR